MYLIALCVCGLPWCHVYPRNPEVACKVFCLVTTQIDRLHTHTYIQKKKKTGSITINKVSTNIIWGPTNPNLTLSLLKKTNRVSNEPLCVYLCCFSSSFFTCVCERKKPLGFPINPFVCLFVFFLFYLCVKRKKPLLY